MSPEEFGALLVAAALTVDGRPMYRDPSGAGWLLSEATDARARVEAAARNLARLAGLPAPESRLALVAGQYRAAGRAWFAWVPMSARPWAIAGQAAGRPVDDWLSAVWPAEGLRARPDAPASGLGCLRLSPSEALGRNADGLVEWRPVTRPRAAVSEPVAAARRDVATRVRDLPRSAVSEALDAAGYAPGDVSDLADLLMVRAVEIGRIYAPDAS